MKVESRSIILGILILCMIVLSVTYYIGKNDKRKWEMDSDNYKYTSELVKTKQAESALGILKNLDEEYPENIYIKRHLGLAYTLTGDSQTGLSYFQECLAITPTIQLDPTFMLQYGEVLSSNGENENAKFIFEKTLYLDGVEPYKNQINDILTKLSPGK